MARLAANREVREDFVGALGWRYASLWLYVAALNMVAMQGLGMHGLRSQEFVAHVYVISELRLHLAICLLQTDKWELAYQQLADVLYRRSELFGRLSSSLMVSLSMSSSLVFRFAI